MNKKFVQPAKQISVKLVQILAVVNACQDIH